MTVAEARDPHRHDRVAALIGTCVFVVGGLVLEFMALLISSFRCYDSCGDRGGWRGERDAWQWDLQLGWATLGLALVIAAVPLAARGRFRWALAAVIASAVTFLGWWAFVTA